MKNNVKLFVPFVLAIIIGSLTFSFAQTGGRAGKTAPDGTARGGRDGFGPGGGGGIGIPPHVLSQLNLTDAQKTQITTLQNDARTASQTYFETIKTADTQLQTLVESGTFSEATARQILATKTQAQTELEIIRLKTDAAIYNLLTAEQRTLLAQLKQQRPNFPGGRPDMPPPPPQD